LLAAPFSYAGGSADKKDGGEKEQTAAPSAQSASTPQTPSAQPAPATPTPPANPYSGKSITILPPRGVGLAANQSYLPDFVANELVSNFKDFSAMTLFDRVNNQRQYDELLSGFYSDDDKAGLDLGHLTSTDYMLLGNITRTSTGFALQLTVNSNSDKTTAAAYSGTVTIAELDNLTGVRRASLDLLQKMGIQISDKARTELTRAAAASHVNAQTAMAQGIVAQRQGTEVAALSYFYQAAAFDPSMLEAVNRGTVMSASITSGNTSGNIGDNVRNDIQWRRDWIARLTSTEEYFDQFFKTTSLPYTLFYSTAINQGKIDYQTETVTLSIDVNLHASDMWVSSVELALQAVYQGLDATKRKRDWGLASWPGTGVTNLKPFTAGEKTFPITVELVNEQNKVIGRQNFTVKGKWSWQSVTMWTSNDDRQTVNFNVKADDITDKITIRIASVNGQNAETAANNGILQIRAISDNEYKLWASSPLGGIGIDSIRGVLEIPETFWGGPVTVIGSRAFQGYGMGYFDSVTIPNSVIIIGAYAFADGALKFIRIPNSVTTIGYGAFYNQDLTNVYIGRSVTTIGAYAFFSTELTGVNIPNSVTTIGAYAFAENFSLTSVTIGANVSIGENAFPSAFIELYNNNGKRAGKYEYNNKDRKWTYSRR
jgi:hypothetical protein